MRLYIYAGVCVAILAGITGAYFKGQWDNDASWRERLASDRIQILKDGKNISQEVANADDDALCGILGGCDVDGLQDEGDNPAM